MKQHHNKKTEEQYSKTYEAQWIREKRERMKSIDPIFDRRYVYVIETPDNKQIVFKNKRDVKKIKKINKKDIRSNFIRAY